MVTSGEAVNGAAGKAPAVTVQTILFDNDPAQISTGISRLRRSIEYAQEAGAVAGVTVRFGDCSAEPTLAERDVISVRELLDGVGTFEYRFFAANLGHGGGHNRLLQNTDADAVLTLNPDAIVAPDAIAAMAVRLTDDVGIVEARQLPFEHPKHFDAETGETGWASGACSLVSVEAFRRAGGYDDSTFFLYGDDVDLSWRVRLAGYRIIYEPGARMYHYKSVTSTGLVVSDAEKYYSAEAALLLPYKYSRPDVFEEVRQSLLRTGAPLQRRAVDAVDERREERLPSPIDPDNLVGYFDEGRYAPQRF